MWAPQLGCGAALPICCARDGMNPSTPSDGSGHLGGLRIPWGAEEAGTLGCCSLAARAAQVQKVQAATGTLEQMERTVATGRALLLLSSRGTEQGGECSACTAGFNSQPRHRLCAHPACLPSDTWGSRAQPHCPYRHFSMSHCTFKTEGCGSASPHVAAASWSFRQLKVCSASAAPVLCHGRLGSPEPLPTGTTQLPHTAWRQGTRHIASPRHCRQNPHIWILPLW